MSLPQRKSCENERRHLWIPAEIVELILEHLKPDPDESIQCYYEKSEALASMTRVSRLFHQVVTPHLWTMVRIDILSMRGMKLFLQSLLLHPHCAERVQDLRLEMVKFRDMETLESDEYVQTCTNAIRTSSLSDELKETMSLAMSDQEHERDELYIEAEIVLILTSCKVQRLNLEVPRRAESSMRMLSAFFTQTPPTIRHLDLCGLDWMAVELGKLAGEFSTLESFKGECVTIEDHLLQNLTTLRLQFCEFPHTTLYDVVRASPNLAILHIEDGEGEELMYLGQSLQQCTRLKKLLLTGCWTDFDPWTIGNISHLPLTHYTIPLTGLFEPLDYLELDKDQLVRELPKTLLELAMYPGDSHRFHHPWVQERITTILGGHLRCVRLKIINEIQDWTLPPGWCFEEHKLIVTLLEPLTVPGNACWTSVVIKPGTDSDRTSIVDGRSPRWVRVLHRDENE